MGTNFSEGSAVSFFRIVLSSWITLIMETASTSETQGSIYQSIRCHVPGVSNLHQHHCDTQSSSTPLWHSIFINTAVTFNLNQHGCDKFKSRIHHLKLLCHAYGHSGTLTAPSPIHWSNSRHFFTDAALLSRKILQITASEGNTPDLFTLHCYITSVSSRWNASIKYLIKAEGILYIH